MMERFLDIIICVESSEVSFLKDIQNLFSAMNDSVVFRFRPYKIRIKFIEIGISFPIKESNYFDFHTNYDEILMYLNSIMILRSTNIRLKNFAFESIALALNSEYDLESKSETNFEKRTSRIIFVFNSSAPNKLEYSNRNNLNYPKNTPETFEQLTELWLNKLTQRKIRKLCVFAPQAYLWSLIYEKWNDVMFCPTSKNDGIDIIDFEDIFINVFDSD